MAAAVGTAVSLAGAFGLPTGVKDVRNLVRSFDYSKLSVVSSENQEYLKVDLAPAFGKLDSDSIKLMDEKLKIMISGTTTAIARLEDKSWANVVATLTQNPLLEPIGDEVHRNDKLIKNGTNTFKFDGSAEQDIVREVETWFKKLVEDEDILTCTGIDIELLGKIVASTGARVDSFETFFARKEYHEQTMVEIGVLRYPDIDHPYFKVYRIQLTAWSDCSRVLFVQEDQNGITGDLRVRKYKPRDSVMDGLKKETRAKAVKQAEALFA